MHALIAALKEHIYLNTYIQLTFLNAILLEWILFLLLIKSWIYRKSNLKIMAVLLLSNFISNTVNYLVLR